MSYEDGKIGCATCGTYAACTDTCPSCAAVLHVGMDPLGCKGDPAYHARPGHGMGGHFPEYWDEHIAPEPSATFKPNFALPEYCPERGYRITSHADRKRLMKIQGRDFRSHPGRSEY